ncbi:MAG: thiamine-monophosphate kinase [Planctomycetes bacterium]|nr:thiamine-monophosphate kinase [Planctomycetota bacterium]
MGELDLIRWIRGRIGKRAGRIVVDSGDDAAVLKSGRGHLLFKTDSVIDGVHFDSRTARPELIGHKAIARCLSDIGAMGCYPTFAVVAIMIPKSAREAYIKRVLAGLDRTAKRFHTPVVGGDVKSHRGKLAISVALLGETRDLRPVRRSGARVGDAIMTTGPLGGSLLGKHLRFTPRVREGIELNRRFEIHSMIDISDGLATDLRHLCEESGVGAVLHAPRIPVAPEARRLSRKDHRPPLDHALYDGEDYELLFTLAPNEAVRVEKAKLGRAIGEISAVDGLYLRSAQGDLREVERRGWEHRFRR